MSYKFEILLTCTACEYHDPQPDCEVCQGNIQYTRSVTVPQEVCERIVTDSASALRQQLESATTRADAMAETIRALTEEVTTDHESKESFIARVKALLEADPDARVSSVRQQLEEAQRKKAGMNSHGLDMGYLHGKLALLIRDMPSHKPSEAARILARLAAVADGNVLREPEFSERRLAETEGQPALTVWYGNMPESNGKSNWTAILHRKDQSFTEGITLFRSEYPDRIRYEADCLRFLIGEIAKEPDLMTYDSDKHSGYVRPTAPASDARVKALYRAVSVCIEEDRCINLTRLHDFTGGEEIPAESIIGDLEDDDPASDARVRELEAALAPFAKFACSPAGECDCFNCKAAAALAASNAEASRAD